MDVDDVLAQTDFFKNTKWCPICNGTRDCNDTFCGHCGNKLTPLPFRIGKCPKCDRVLDFIDFFCPKCGTKREWNKG